MIKVLTIALLILSRAPDGHWEYIDPSIGKWERTPTGPEEWHWIYPGEDWRLDPKGHWRIQ